MPTTYRVDLTDVHSHQVVVEMSISSDQPLRELDLSMAAWTPGSYFLRHYGRNVSRFAPSAGGKALGWRKTDRQTWRVDAGDAHEVTVRYRVYGYDESVRGVWLTDEEGFWTGAALYLIVRGWEDRPSTVQVTMPDHWKSISTGLARADAPQTFTAKNYDDLVDCPVLAGPFEIDEFSFAGKPHYLALSGHGNFDRPKLVADLAKVVEAGTGIFACTPYDEYTFQLRLTGGNWGGLEHLNSSVSNVPATSFKPDHTYRTRVLRLLSHEFFHVWNVKRLRPIELGPFDYGRENYTSMLWLAEGVTSYYESYILRRGDLLSADEYLDVIGRQLSMLAGIPGRHEDSLEQSSWDAWIKLYVPDENSVNRSVSYYLKGAVAMMCLDLDLRARTGGERGLEDVLRDLYTRYHDGEGRGVTTAEFRESAQQIAGDPLAIHFDKHLSTTEEIDVAPFLTPFGLELETRAPSAGGDDDEITSARGFLGAKLDVKEGGVSVTHVRAGTPAEEHGLYANDEILSIAGFRVRTTADVDERLDDAPPGTRVEFLVSRRGQVRPVSLVTGEEPHTKHVLRRVKAPTPAQKELYQRLMFASWPEPKDAGPSA